MKLITSAITVLWVIVLNLVFSESAFVDTLSQCKLEDENCEKDLLVKILTEVAPDGVPELDVPPIDPIKLSNFIVNIPDILKMELIEGEARGIKDCSVNTFKAYVSEDRIFLDITCNLWIEGKYSMFVESPLITSYFDGKSIKGEGDVQIEVDKINLKFDFFFSVEKKDGDFYLKFLTDQTKYEYEVLGKMEMHADNIYVGDVESSKAVTDVVNKNWPLVMTSFGGPFVDEVMVIVNKFIDKFISSIPAKHFITDDLSSHVKA